MSNPFDFFDQIYCINLPEAHDRWSKVSEVFTQLDIIDRIQRVSATLPNPNIFKPDHPTMSFPVGMVGCSLSHLKALTIALACNAKNVLIFEDDVIFNRVEIPELPALWDVLYLGGEPYEQTVLVSPSLVRVGEFLGTYAYAVNEFAIPKLIAHIIDNLTTALDGGSMCTFNKTHEAYAINPPLCRTVPNVSMITNRVENYDKETDYAWKRFT